MKKWFSLLLPGLWLIASTGCEDGAGSVGVDGIDPAGSSGSFRRDTLYAEAVLNDTSFVDSISTYEMQKLYLGSFESYDFKIVMRFILPADVESVTVREARIELVPSGYSGTGNNLTAVVRPIKKSWVESDILWTRFDTPDAVGDPILQLPVTKADTGGAKMVFSVPTDTVQNWVWARTDTNRKNFGLMLDYGEGADLFVQQFFSGQTKGSDSKPDPALAPRMVFSFDRFEAGNTVVDSIILYPVLTRNGYLGTSTYNQGIHGYLYRDRSPQDANSLTVGGAVIYHSFMRIGMDSIPHDATIASASLIMTLDPSGAYQYDPSDSDAVQAVRLLVGPGDWYAGKISTNASDVFDLQTSAAVRARWTDIVTDDTLKLNITAFAQSWLSNPQNNHGIKLFHGYEIGGNSRLYRVRFHRDPSDRMSAPRLAIYYTVPPEY